MQTNQIREKLIECAFLGITIDYMDLYHIVFDGKNYSQFLFKKLWNWLITIGNIENKQINKK